MVSKREAKKAEKGRGDGLDRLRNIVAANVNMSRGYRRVRARRLILPQPEPNTTNSRNKRHGK